MSYRQPKKVDKTLISTIMGIHHDRHGEDRRKMSMFENFKRAYRLFGWPLPFGLAMVIVGAIVEIVLFPTYSTSIDATFLHLIDSIGTLIGLCGVLIIALVLERANRIERIKKTNGKTKIAHS